MLHASSTAWTALLIAWAIASRRSAFAPASGLRRRHISATLRSGCQEATSALSAGSLPLGPAGLGLTPVPSADHSTPPESWSGRVRSPRRGVAPPPTSASGYRRRRAHDRESIQRPSIVRTRLETAPWERSWTGAIHVGDGDVVAARAPHPHDVPRIDDFALLAAKVYHAHLGLVSPDPSSSTKTVDEIQSVPHEGDERGAAEMCILPSPTRRPSGGGRTGRRSGCPLRGCRSPRLLRRADGNRRRPSPGDSPGPRRSRVVATDLLTDEGAGDGVGLQPPSERGVVIRRSPVSRSAFKTGCDSRRSRSASSLCARIIGAISRAASSREVSGSQGIWLVLGVDRVSVIALTSASPERCSG